MWPKSLIFLDTPYSGRFFLKTKTTRNITHNENVTPCTEADGARRPAALTLRFWASSSRSRSGSRPWWWTGNTRTWAWRVRWACTRARNCRGTVASACLGEPRGHWVHGCCGTWEKGQAKRATTRCRADSRPVVVPTASTRRVRLQLMACVLLLATNGDGNTEIVLGRERTLVGDFVE